MQVLVVDTVVDTLGLVVEPLLPREEAASNTTAKMATKTTATAIQRTGLRPPLEVAVKAGACIGIKRLILISSNLASVDTVRIQRKGLSTMAFVGAVVAVAVVLGAVGFFAASSGSSGTSTVVVTQSSTTTVSGATGSNAVSTATVFSTQSTVTTTTKTVVSTTFSSCAGCINDADGDGV